MHIAAEFAVLGTTTIEHQAVAALDRTAQGDLHAARADCADPSDTHTAVARVTTDHQRLVLWSFEEPRGQAVGIGALATGKHLGEMAPLFD